MPPSFDSERFRAVRDAFPIAARRAYFFAGGMAPLSQPSREALEAYAALSASDPVDVYMPRHEVAELRATIARFLRAQPQDVAILDSTSRGNNLAVQMLDAPPGANVVLDSTTYPSARMPWLLPPKAHVALREVRAEHGLPVLEDFERLVDDRTLAVSVSHVCPRTGFRHDLRALADIAHTHDALLLVDGAQSVGAVSIDVERDHVDMLAFGAMKWLLGTPGVAFFYVRSSLSERLPLAQVGPSGAELKDGCLQPLDGAARYELSSGHWGGLAASRRGAELLLPFEPSEVEQGILSLSGQLVDGLHQRDIAVLTPSDERRRAGVVVFEHDQPDALRAHLRARGVDVWGWQDRRRMRADPHVYNTPAEVDILLAGIDAFR